MISEVKTVRDLVADIPDSGGRLQVAERRSGGFLPVLSGSSRVCGGRASCIGNRSMISYYRRKLY